MLAIVTTFDYSVTTYEERRCVMATVGIRELKARLSQYLERVRQGERVVVTARGRPIALISPAARPEGARIADMIRDGAALWDGKVPRGAARPPRLAGSRVSDTVVEDRR